MDLAPSPADEAFRREARQFLVSSLGGDFAPVRGRGGPGREDDLVESRREWEAHLGRHGWNGAAWPAPYGRGLSLSHQVIWNEEYVTAGGPGRLGHIGETLVGPTLVVFGTEAQRERFLPRIQDGSELWCQGYSEPGAGSDLAAISTQARLDASGRRWVLQGQKVWTSAAHLADWCFVLARSEPGAQRHRGLSYLLVPMDQPGVNVRPLRQLTGSCEFNEVFFDGALTEVANVVGPPGEGWKVAMGTLAFERGASTLAQVLHFQEEFEAILAAARRTGRDTDPVLRQQMAALWSRLRIMRLNALRVLSVDHSGSGPATITKLFWADLHREMGELAITVAGMGGQASTGEAGALGQGHPGRPEAVIDDMTRLFLFSRADTIYGGTDEIQRNIIGERALGLPREPR
jgi:alkylation response protein AidB-like acyl-CoA dehydrogenase